MPSPYEERDLAKIREAMNERYKIGSAYTYRILWDIERHKALYKGIGKVIEECLRQITGLHPTPGRKLNVVDLGCGLGTAFDCLPDDSALRSFDVQATLVDLSDEAIRRLSGRKEELEKKWLGKVEFQFLACAAEDMAHHVSDQDLVISVESIEHWADVDAGVRGVHACLSSERPSFFCLTTPNRDSLHVRIARKLGQEPPFCSPDHTYEYGYEELDRIVGMHGFKKIASTGASFAPYWAIRGVDTPEVRRITDHDPDVLAWFQTIGMRCPEFAFCQVKAFQRKD